MLYNILVINLALNIIIQSFAQMTHYAIVMKVIITGYQPYMLMYLWLYQLVLTNTAVYLHEQFLFQISRTTLATVRLYV